MAKKLNPVFLAWSLPLTMLVHQLEEFFGGFLEWFPSIMNVNLSQENFLIINSIALLILLFFAITYSLVSRNNFLLMTFGTLLFVNGAVHILISIITLIYSPGAISGLILFLPLGGVIYQRIYPELPKNQRIPSIATGILLLFIVNMIARSTAMS